MVVMKYYNVLVGKEKSLQILPDEYLYNTALSLIFLYDVQYRASSYMCIISCSEDMGSGRLLFQYFHIQFNSTRNNTK